MPRPMKSRKVCCLPEMNRFGPLDAAGKKAVVINLKVEEYEAVRLIDLEGFTQEACAEHMNVARTTIQGIYIDARKKLADALVNGKNIQIEGGNYMLCSEPSENCGRGCRRRGH